VLGLTLTWECLVLQKKSRFDYGSDQFDYGSDADDTEQILKRLEGTSDSAVGEESREAASPTVPGEGGPLRLSSRGRVSGSGFSYCPRRRGLSNNLSSSSWRILRLPLRDPSPCTFNSRGGVLVVIPPIETALSLLVEPLVEVQ